MGERVSTHPALPAQYVMVVNSIPLAWLVARLTGCTVLLEDQHQSV